MSPIPDDLSTIKDDMVAVMNTKGIARSSSQMLTYPAALLLTVLGNFAGLM